MKEILDSIKRGHSYVRNVHHFLQCKIAFLVLVNLWLKLGGIWGVFSQDSRKTKALRAQFTHEKFNAHEFKLIFRKIL